MLYFVLIIAGFAGTRILTPYFKDMICEAGMVRKNYKEDPIPVSMGMSFLPLMLVNCAIILYFEKYEFASTYMFAVMAMSFAGIIDDTMGNRGSSGFKGHFKALFKGKLTTGAFKALFGGLVALFASIPISGGVLDIIINTLLIALFTNFFNLMDLRPGRAIKVYFTSCAAVFPFIPSDIRLLAVGSISSVMGYFPEDIKARAMMGDAGSNVLGVSLGMLVALGLDGGAKIGALIFLVLVHLMAEKYSITKMIEGNRVLDYLDKMGR